MELHKQFLKALSECEGLTEEYNRHLLELKAIALEASYREILKGDRLHSIVGSKELEVFVGEEIDHVEKWRQYSSDEFIDWLKKFQYKQLTVIAADKDCAPLSVTVDKNLSQIMERNTPIIPIAGIEAVSDDKEDELSAEACNWVLGQTDHARSLVSIESQRNILWNKKLRKLLNLSNEQIRERSLTKAWQPFTNAQQQYMNLNKLPTITQLSAKILELPHGNCLEAVRYYGRLPNSCGEEEFGIITSNCYHWLFNGESHRGMETLTFDPISKF